MARVLPGTLLLGTFVLILWQSGRTHATPTGYAGTRAVVEDGCGAEVPLGEPGRDIVLMTPTIAEYLFVSRSADRLLSGYAANGSVVKGTLLAKRFPALDGPRIVNNRVPQASSVEWLMATQPTAVLAWPFQVDGLRSAGVPALCVLQGPTFDEARRNAVTVGQLTGTIDRARHLAQQYLDDMRAVAEATAGLEPVPAMFIAVSANGRLAVMGRASEDKESILAANVRDVSPRSAGTTILNAEQLIMLDPAMIVLGSGGVDWEGPDAGDFMADPRWQSLRAVKHHRVYAKPRGMSIYFSGLVETPLQARWLAEVAHPDKLAPKLREMMNARYRDAFGADTSDAEFDAVLRTRENRDGCGYERFLSPRGMKTARQTSCTDG